MLGGKSCELAKKTALSLILDPLPHLFRSVPGVQIVGTPKGM